MKRSRVCALGLALLTLAACGDRTLGGLDPDQLNSSVRYVNAIPDTGRVNVRFIDFVEGNTTVAGMALRDSSGGWTPSHDGLRHFNVFRFDSVPAGASIKLIDTMFTMVPGGRHTVWLAGFARSGATPRMRAHVTEDNPPTPGANQWQARVMNLNGSGNVDVYVYRGAGTTPAAGAAPTYANVAFVSPTSYETFATATDWRVHVCPAGAPSNSATCANRVLAAGVAGSNTGNLQDPIPGTNIAGSVFTFAVIPPRVVGSQALSTATTLFVRSMVDRRPPSACTPSPC